MVARHTPAESHRADDDLYASTGQDAGIPKSSFPARGRPARSAYALVHDELMLDGNARQNLATFCQTWEEPEVHRLMDECIDKNMVDKDEYPQTAEIEVALRAHAGRPVEFAGRRRTRWAARPPVRARPRCWAAWP